MFCRRSHWEYACRAGTTTAYSWGNEINAIRANYNASGRSQTSDVGYYDANQWGFFDMHGNVREWVQDWKANYPLGAQTDPAGSVSGSYRVLRGGSFFSGGPKLRSARRSINNPSHSSLNGFRLAFRQITTPRSNLNTTGPLTIAENQLVGTIVGEFNATDPDTNSTLTYHLVNGVGDGNNSLFTLDSNCQCPD